MDKDKIINEMKSRPGFDNVNVESLYHDAIQDVMDFTHQSREYLENQAIESIIKDLMAFRFNTLGVEGLKSEGFSGVSTNYEGDIPKRIKRKLMSHRRLNYESK